METDNNIDLIQEMDTAQIFSLTSDISVQKNLSALRFLSKIKHGEKINAKDLFVRDNDSVIQRLLRTVRNFTAYISASDIVESKESTLKFIQETVDDSITLIAVYRQDRDDFKQSIADIIVKNLEESKGGVWKLIQTYRDDRRFISDAEAVLLTLDARVKSLKKKGYMKGFSDDSFMPKELCEINPLPELPQKNSDSNSNSNYNSNSNSETNE